MDRTLSKMYFLDHLITRNHELHKQLLGKCQEQITKSDETKNFFTSCRYLRMAKVYFVQADRIFEENKELLSELRVITG